MGDLEEAKVYVGNVIGKDLLGNDLFVFKEAGFVKEDIKLERPKYKNGDFIRTRSGSLMIYKETKGEDVSAHFFLGGYLTNYHDDVACFVDSIGGYCTPDECHKILGALQRDGKRWNEEKKCIEGIPKFKIGDKVMLKKGNKDINGLHYLWIFDDYIGQELTVCCYTEEGNVRFNETAHSFAEEWLEPYKEELKEGDLAIFWDEGSEENAIVHISGQIGKYGYYDEAGLIWSNAIKFESKEQFEKILKDKK